MARELIMYFQSVPQDHLGWSRPCLAQYNIHMLYCVIYILGPAIKETVGYKL